jgi:hypothetical protein
VALRRVVASDTCPTLADVLDVGHELHERGLDTFISEAIPDRPSHRSCARYLLRTAARWHQDGSQKKEADERQVEYLLGTIRGPGLWLAVRGEWAKFVRLAEEELKCRLPPTAAEVVNSLQLVGEVWQVRYEAETACFKDRTDSVLRHLARVLAEPGRRFAGEEFYPPPPGGSALPRFGRDALTDNQAAGEYRAEMERLTQEIREANDAHDAEEAARLRREFDELAEFLPRERGFGASGRVRACGTPSPVEQAGHALGVGLERLKARFRKKGLPGLADHLDEYLSNTGGRWFYAPPPGTPPWHVSLPATAPEN